MHARWIYLCHVLFEEGKKSEKSQLGLMSSESANEHGCNGMLAERGIRKACHISDSVQVIVCIAPAQWRWHHHFPSLHRIPFEGQPASRVLPCSTEKQKKPDRFHRRWHADFQRKTLIKICSLLPAHWIQKHENKCDSPWQAVKF